MRPDGSEDGEVVTFHRIFPAAIPPMRADNSALGTLPAGPFQYCEPVRTASAFGWYVFPPTDIRLRWDGSETLYDAGGDWQPLVAEHISDQFIELWENHAPADLKERVPPFLSITFVPGIIQIWSGFFVSTAAGWSLLVRAPANLVPSRTFAHFEGLIETDEFKPCPLFINIRLLSTDREIVLPRLKPLFQAQPIQRQCYAEATLRYRDFDELARESGNAFGLTETDWQGIRRTIRSADPTDSSHKVGSYAVRARRRLKNDGE